MSSKSFTPKDADHIAKLANIPVTDKESTLLAKGFTTTMEVVDKLFTVDVRNVTPTHQVTGKSNTFRNDVVDESRMFGQEQALANAKRTHNGYFVVPAVFEEQK